MNLSTNIKQSKYKNTKIIVDGIKFDSKIESNIYLKLKELKSKLLFLDYQLQPKYTLVDKFKLGKKSIRSVDYVGDFLVFIRNRQYVIDVKGLETPVFKLKAKLFAWKFGNEIVTVKSLKGFQEWFIKEVSYVE